MRDRLAKNTDEAAKEASSVQTEQTGQSANLHRNKRRSASPFTASTSEADLSSSVSPPKRIKISASHIFQRNLRLFRQGPSSGWPRPLSSSLELPRRHERQKSVELLLTASLPELHVKYFRAKMAFAFNQAAEGTSQAHPAPDLEEIQTEAVGFLAIAGESKVRLLPNAWPSDALPPTTSSLLSIASQKGLLAAAGPDVLILAKTDSVRQAFTATGPSSKPFHAQLSIPVPRVSQVVFSADENVLVISAEDGGGLAVYEVHSLLQGVKKEIFQLGTNGMSVRALVPNPMPELAEYLAAVTNRGELMLANLKTRELVNGPNGPILKDNVSCVSWSAKGKQLIAGLGDGTAYQMTPTGENKASIPRPPTINGDIYVSSIYWLANDDFLCIYMQASPPKDTPPDSAIFLVHREKGTSHYSFHKLPDPCPPFGMNRFPPHHFIVRLRDFKPNLNDALLVSSTAAGDVGLLTRSEAPLSSDLPAHKITNTYTTTMMAVDSRRAQLPVTEEMTDTSPIGVALDLSSDEKVTKPIPADEMDESSTPLPNLMILNNEGILCSWWFVHNESIRQGTIYPGLKSAGSVQPTPAQSAPQPSYATVPRSGFANLPQKPAAATSFGASAFGVGSSFGTPAAIGTNKSPWGTPSAAGVALQTNASSFGKPAFGSATPIGNTGSQFGATNSFGNKASPWAAAPVNNQDQPSSSVRSISNASGGGNVMAANSFSSFGSTGGDASPFANAANKSNASPFSTLGQQVKSGQSTFASAAPPGLTNSFGFGKTQEPSFGSTVTMGSSAGGSTVESGKSIFGLPSTNGTSANALAQPVDKLPQNDKNEMVDIGKSSTEADRKENEKPDTVFGLKPGAFTLQSTFQEEASARESSPKPLEKANSNFFGSDFGKALDNAKPKEPATPVKTEPGLNEPKLKDISTTPASPPRSNISGKQNDESTLSPSKVSDAGEKKPGFQESNRLTFTEKIDPVPFPPTPGALNPAPADVSPLAESPGISTEAPSSPLSSPDEEGGSDRNTDERGEVREVEHEGEIPNEDELDELSNGSEDELDQDDTSQSVVVTEEAPLPPDPSTIKSSKPAAEWSFESVPKSPERVVESSPAVTALRPQQQSTTPYGLPKVGPVIPSPTPRLPASPRSPSPATLASASFTKPSTTQTRKPASRSNFEASPDNKLKPIVGEDLSDNEDEKIREELAIEPEPKLQLAPFLAHQDYVGNVTKEGIPGQIERVYRDINSMIDTLGLNAKSVASFIKGHSKPQSEGELTRDDLAAPSSWNLRELEDFKILKSLGQFLEDERLHGPRDKLNTLSVAALNFRRLRAHAIYNRRALQAHLVRYGSTATTTGSQQSCSYRYRHQSAPLPPDTAAQQAKLRRAAASLQKLLAAAEEAAIVLRAQLATAQSSGPSPTVDAVSNTIRKMTALAAQKSADIDWLETQLRRHGLTKASTSASASPSPAPAALLPRSEATPSPRQTVPYTPPARVGQLVAMPKELRHTEGQNSPPAAVSAHSPTDYSPRVSAWSTEDDRKLKAARAQGLNWGPIAAKYFPTMSANKCRIRHELLIERKQKVDSERNKLEDLATAHKEVRQEIADSDDFRTKFGLTSSMNSIRSNASTGKDKAAARSSTPFVTPPPFRASRAGAGSMAMPLASWSGTSASTTNNTSKSYGLFYTPDEGRGSSVKAYGAGPRGGGNDDINGISNFGRLSLGVQNSSDDSRGILRARRAKRRFVAERLKEGVEKEGVKITIVG